MSVVENIDSESQKLIEQIPLPFAKGLILLDQEGNPADLYFLQINNLFENIAAFKRESIVGKKLSEFSPDFDEIMKTDRMIRDLKEYNKDHFSYEIYITSRNKWYEVHFNRFDDHAFALLITDSSERKTQLNDLMEGHETFKSIYENVSVGIYRASMDGKILMANKALLKLLKYNSYEDVSSRNIENHRILIDISNDEFYRDLIKKDVLTGFESSWQTSDGNAVYVLESTSLVRDRNNNPVYYEGTVEDISQKKIAENQLKQLNNIFVELGVDSRKNIGIIVKKTSMILNGACSLYNRLDDREESLFIWSEYNAPEDIAREDKPDGHICYEATIKGKDKTIVIEDIRKTPYYETDPTVKKYNLRSYLGHPVIIDGQPIGSLCVVDTRVRNFTETEKKIISTLAIALSLEHKRYQLETHLEKSRNEAETANLAKSQFLANMSHEIRTPLNGIMGFSEILINQESDEKKHRMLSLIEESGNQLLQLINDIFDYSMIEAGRMSMNETGFNLMKVIIDTIDLFRPAAEKKGLQIILDDEDSAYNQLYGDHHKFSQILMNLVSNAVKFTDVGTILIIVKSAFEGSHVTVDVTVEDTGIGINPEKLENIFIEFEQLEYYLTKKTKGTGLGLAITKKLVTFLNGRIQVESETGKGSRFIVQIPFQLKINQKTDVDMNKPDDTQTELKRKVKILLAEDNEANQFLIKAITKSENWDITVVDDGDQAVEEYRKHDFDLILMDVQMPVLNGYEATRIIRDLEKNKDTHIPIIALTAYAMKSDKDQCIEAGMDNYISKPFKKQQFIDTITEMLNSE